MQSILYAFLLFICPNMLFSNSMGFLTHDQLIICYKFQVTWRQLPLIMQLCNWAFLSEYSILDLLLNIIHLLAYPFSNFANIILNLKSVFHFTDSLFQLQIVCKLNKQIITVS